MRAAESKESRQSYVKAWSLIVDAVADMGRVAARISDAGMTDQRVLPEKQLVVRKRLDELEESLSQLLGKADAHRLLVPLVLHTDEQFLNRIPEKNHQAWPLLQVDLFGINNGGEQFFALIEEELRKAQGTPLLLEVFSYCLGHGFVGRMRYKDPDGRERIKDAELADYQHRLTEQLHLLPRTARAHPQARLADRTGRSEADAASRAPGAHMPLIAPLMLYVGTLVLMLLLPFVFIFVSNIELVPVRQSDPVLPVSDVRSRDSVSESGEPAPSRPVPKGSPPIKSGESVRPAIPTKKAVFR